MEDVIEATWEARELSQDLDVYDYLEDTTDGA